MTFDFKQIYSNKAIMRLKYKGAAVYALWRDGRLRAYQGSPFAGGQPEAGELKINDVEEVLAPCQPSKVVAIGLNYHLHARELNMAVPAEPLIFIKPATSVIGAHAAIKKPAMAGRVDFEGELAVIIAKTCHNLSEAEALDYVLGYTCLNDVTARDLQAKDGQFTRSKSFDTFCPIGPAIALDVDPQSLSLRTLVNGQIKQDSTTADMIFSVSRMVAFISQVMTLLPGDVIATGTPPGIGTLQLHDKVVVELQDIGRLENQLQ